MWTKARARILLSSTSHNKLFQKRTFRSAPLRPSATTSKGSRAGGGEWRQEGGGGGSGWNQNGNSGRYAVSNVLCFCLCLLAVLQRQLFEVQTAAAFETCLFSALVKCLCWVYSVQQQDKQRYEYSVSAFFLLELLQAGHQCRRQLRQCVAHYPCT